MARYDIATGISLGDPIRQSVSPQASAMDSLRQALLGNQGQIQSTALERAGIDPVALENASQRMTGGGVRSSVGSFPERDYLVGQAELFSGESLTGYQPPELPQITVAQDMVGNVQNALDTIGRAQAEAAAAKAQENRRTGVEGMSWNKTDPQDRIDSSFVKSTYARELADFQAPYLAQIEELEGAYQTRISELQTELAGYRGGLVDVNAAYSEYADDADAILSQAAAVEAEMLPPSAVEEEVDHTYSQHDGAMQETLSRIDSSGNEALAQAMSEEVTRTQEVMVDGLRSDMMTQNEMHQLASAQAQALANMAWKDDAYNAERQRFELELQINQAISGKQEQIQTTRDEMTAAIADVRSQMSQFEMAPDELWSAALSDFGQLRGLNAYEVEEMRRSWAGLMENPVNESNYASFKGELQRAVTAEAIDQVGLTDYVAALQAYYTAQEDEGALGRLDSLLSSSDLKAALNSLARMNPAAAGDRTGLDLWNDYKRDGIGYDEAVSLADPMYDSMLDLWNHYSDFKQNYDSYTQVAQTASKGTAASSNWDNRYQPAYTYRREVAAPQFADEVKSVFPGVRVGALGYIRDVNDVGNGRAANSDHQSGGALDLYADTFEELEAIERWAMGQPGVSYVIYSGNSAHQKSTAETSHVHVSLLLGYGFGG